MRTIQIVGAPMDLGQGRRGVDMGCLRLRYAELERRLEALGYAVTDLGNLDVPGPEEDETPPDAQGLRHLGAVARVNRQLAECCRCCHCGAIPLALGGDHSMAAGSVAGVRAAGRVGVLWVDAHADFNTPQTSPSRNLHGMPLGALLGQEPAALAPYLTEERLAVEDAIILGLRSVDGGERELLRCRGVTVFSIATSTNRASPPSCVACSITSPGTTWNACTSPSMPIRSILPLRPASALRPRRSFVPAKPTDHGTPRRRWPWASMDIVEINPILDDRNHTADLCVALAASLLGQSIL
ncbi:MAG: arginase family protein [Caldilineaceae bacterium]